MKNLSLIFIAFLFLQFTSLAQNKFLIDTISTTSCEQFHPKVSSDGNNYMVVWEDDRNAYLYQIEGAIIDRSGSVTNKIELYNQGGRSCPAIAFDGTNYFVCYGHGDDYIKLLRYDQNGNIIQPALPDVIFEPYCNGGVALPLIAYGNSNYIVLCEYGCPMLYWGFMGKIIDPSVNTIGGFDNNGDNSATSISFDGENYFITYFHGWFGEDIYGMRIDSLGNEVDTMFTPIMTSPNDETNPKVAFDGTNYLVVWEESTSGNDIDLYCTRVTPSFEVLDPLGLPITIADGNQENHEITFDGENYIVIWEDYRNGIESDIYGAKVDTAGNVVESFAISNQEGDQFDPVLCKGSGSQVMVVYSGWTGEYQGKTYNSMRIWGKLLGMPSDIEDGENKLIVSDYELGQNYPNPLNPSTKIWYSVPQQSNIVIRIYDVLGNKIETLVSEEKPAGTYEITWYAEGLPSGVYFYRLQAGSVVVTKKMILIH